MPVIVVVGAGVSGLTSALLLSANPDNVITIVAKHMPGDLDIEYASPWAGANVLPMLSAEESHWESATWPALWRVAREFPEAGIHFQKSRVFRRDKDMEPNGSIPADHLFATNPWYKSLMPNYRELNQNEVIPGHDSGCEFDSLCINTPIYLAWLLGQCRKNGVAFQRADLQDINEAIRMSYTETIPDVVVNCTGLGSLRLGGVKDEAMMPARGQTVLVRNECNTMVCTSGTDDGPTEMTYIMQRAAGGGTILGGTYDIGKWESAPDPNIALRIMNRAVKTWPSLSYRGIEGLEVIRHNVGLRPYRKGGVRLERGTLLRGTPVVHNYGHAGWGYQGSYGCAERVVQLVDEALKQKMFDNLHEIGPSESLHEMGLPKRA